MAGTVSRYYPRAGSVEAVQWFVDGDSKLVEPFVAGVSGVESPTCEECGQPWTKHGQISQHEGDYVCSGDYVFHDRGMLQVMPREQFKKRYVKGVE